MVSSSNKLKQRSIYLYLPSTKMAENWKTRAEKQNLSVSKFVVEHVLDSIRAKQKEDQAAFSKSDLAKELREPKEELKRVTKVSSLYRQLSEKLDNELKYYRTRRLWMKTTRQKCPTINSLPILSRLMVQSTVTGCLMSSALVPSKLNS
jgi:hypothetical protein